MSFFIYRQNILANPLSTNKINADKIINGYALSKIYGILTFQGYNDNKKGLFLIRKPVKLNGIYIFGL